MILFKTKPKTKIKKRLVTGIEIVLIISLALGGLSGLGNYRQKKKLKDMSQQNVEQAQQIETLTEKVDAANDQKDAKVEELQANEEKLENQVKLGFSVLYEQAVDIEEEHPSTYTKAHTQTAKEYVKVWGYDALAGIIKWQQEQIAAQLDETKRLMEEKQQLKTEYLEYKVKTKDLIHETKNEAKEHRNHAQTLKDDITDHLANNSWLSNVIWYLAIGTGIYFFITMGGLPLFFKLKNNAINKIQEQLAEEKKKKSKALKGIKTFKAANQEGNETMDKLLGALGVDLDDDDD